MQTTSVLIQSLCVPCFNRCRYCLLSWNGRLEGTDWDRSVRLAKRYLKEIRARQPELSAAFAFGYSMEHPDLRAAIRTLHSLGSPMADFLQCDGMQMRNEEACRALMEMLREEGIRRLNFTVYGSPEYHDAFAGRRGDHALLMRMMHAAREFRIPFSTGIPVTRENIGQVEESVGLLRNLGSERISLFIPHEEGRGWSLRHIRLREQDMSHLSPETRSLLNRALYRTEGDWLSEPPPVENSRMILISLRPETIEAYEGTDALTAIRETEELDERYSASFPDFRTLSEMYGDPAGRQLYRFRDLQAHYRRRYAAEHDLHLYDVTDERQSGSRRY